MILRGVGARGILIEKRISNKIEAYRRPDESGAFFYAISAKTSCFYMKGNAHVPASRS
jgi:hypothetical protein